MGNPIRVLHVVVNLNRGGAETLLMNLYRHIDRQKIQFDFLTCKPGVFDHEVEELGGKIHRIPYVTDGGHFNFIKELRSFFNENPDYKIVHSHLDKMSGLILREAEKVGVPVRIAHSHSTKSEGNFIVRTYKWLVNYLFINNASHLFACSSQASKWLFGRKADASTILKNGIDIDKFRYSKETREKFRALMEIDNSSFVIGHVGRFSSPKNHDFLIDIFSTIIKIHPDSYLTLVGDGPLKSRIEKKVVNLGLQKKVKFLGVRDDVHLLLQCFNVLLFPSIYEGLPVTLVEAQASELPCIISDVIAEEIDAGVNLIQRISLSNSPMVWAERTLRAERIKNKVHNELRQNGFDIQITATWLQDYYIKLLPIHSNLPLKGVI